MYKFSKLCTPAQLYLVLVVIGIIVGLFNHVSIMSVVMKLLFALLWTYLLNFLCAKGYAAVSWFLVLLPFIIIALAMIGLKLKK